jgi:hypothetical protein
MASFIEQLRPDELIITSQMFDHRARLRSYEIVAALRAAGVTARAYEQLGVYGIDADLPSPTTPELRRVLQSRGIALPADGVLQIEIRAPR